MNDSVQGYKKSFTSKISGKKADSAKQIVRKQTAKMGSKK
jgi:hypothetical protein